MSRGMPNFARTRKPHSKHMKDVRGKFHSSKRVPGNAKILRGWFAEGQGGSRFEYNAPLSPERSRIRYFSAKYAGGVEAVYGQTRIKDARRYAAKLKKKDPDKFNQWLYGSGFKFP